MRKPKETTYDISMEAYKLLLNCCERYYDNLAWKYTNYCHLCHECKSLDYKLLNTALRYDIPTLFRSEGKIVAPKCIYNMFDEPEYEQYDQYALIDLIEFIAVGCKDFTYEENTPCNHYNMLFNESEKTFIRFQKEINNIFEMVGLLYRLNDNHEIERIVEYTLISKDIEDSISQIKENETRKLLQEGITLYKTPYPSASRDAAEKIWDAFERLKTYYTSLDKKQSSQKIVNDISNGKQEFIELFNYEFKSLTEIGNKFRIRHHETDKIDITDNRHFDYFFNRCLSMIALAIQYLE